MKVRIEKSFDHDVDKVKDKKLLQKISFIISGLESAAEVKDIPRVKKIKSFSSFYRIKIGDYRLGMELTPGNEIILLRFLHRKDIYRHFPKKGSRMPPKFY